DDCVIGGTFFFKRTSLLNLGGFPNVAYGDDTALFTNAETSSLTIAKTDYPSYIYHREMIDSLCNEKKNST
ncbi:MAG: glycosyltransferase family 2 protein, partial [Bacteroidota bacterium]